MVDNKQTPSEKLLTRHPWPITATQTDLIRHPKKQWQTERVPHTLKHAVTNRVQLGANKLVRIFTLSPPHNPVCRMSRPAER